MSKFEKLKVKIREGKSISYDEAENLLYKLGFHMGSRGSHHNFKRDGYPKNIAIKKRSELLPYQIKLILEVIEYYEE